MEVSLDKSWRHPEQNGTASAVPFISEQELYSSTEDVFLGAHFLRVVPNCLSDFAQDTDPAPKNWTI